jgi:class 3 adenylate cyclase/tetratricopeptide (TPR) repeat protein
MTFEEILDQAIAMLQRRGRLTYRTLQRQFQLDDDALNDLRDELLYAHPEVHDDAGRGLMWSSGTGPTPAAAPAPAGTPEPTPLAYTPGYLAEKILASRAVLEGERKQVTVLFADLKGSTELIEGLDPEDARRLLDPAVHAMMEAVHRYEGTVNQVLGDGIMALFGAPVAHEDHAVRACYAALALQAAMRRYAEEVRRSHGLEMQARVGLNSGEVVVRAIGNDLHMDYSAIGQTTHLAARMEQLATPGSIRLTAATLRLAEGLVQVKALGLFPVKGLTEPVEVFELAGASTIRSRLQASAVRGLTRFVGRQQELMALQQALEWAGMGHGQVAALLRLDPLPPVSAEEFLAALLGNDPSLEPLKQLLMARTEGNPFFLEESIRTLVETGVLMGEPGAYRLAQALPAIQVPATVQAILAARIDRLQPQEKHLLQTAAVIGTEVPLPLLQAIAELPETELYRGLAHLQAAEFLYETRLFPEQAYTFTHALTHEVAYSSLLLEQRRGLHGRVVQALEALAPERVAEQVERLAQHALRGEVWNKAVIYCQHAGARADARAALREEAAYFEQALQALAHLREHGDTRAQAIDLRLAVALPLIALGEYGRCLAILGEAEALARALDDRGRLGRVLAVMAQVLRITGASDGAIAAGRQALDLATALGDSTLQKQASHNLGMVYYVMGDFGQAAELLRRNVEVIDREADSSSIDVRLRSQAWLARSLGVLGVFVEGRRHGEEALQPATLAGGGFTPIITHACLGSLYLAKGDLEPAVRVLERGLALGRAAGNRNWLRVIVTELGSAYVLQGRLAEGRTLLEEALNESARTATPHAYPMVRLSEVCRLAGRGEEAWQYARQALDLARQQKARGDEALALYQLGVVHTR